MKTKLNIRQGILFLVLNLFLMTACQNDETNSENSEEIGFDDELALKSTEIDLIGDDIDFIVEEGFQEDETHTSFLPDCVTITNVISSGYRQRTVDFGTGCELPNGNILSGIITASHEVDANPARRMISVTFTNFQRNGVSVEGSRSIERVLANDFGNPQSTAIVDMQVTWPNGATYTREGTRVREWIEGFGSGTWTDNVFSITGNVTTTGVAGNTYSANITDALRRELTCSYIVSGTIALSRNNATGTLDFGNGTCDNEVAWTHPTGTTIIFYLN